MKCLSNLFQLEQCNAMFKAISNMTHRYEMWNTILIEILFWTGKKLICGLMFIISNHHGINCLVIYYPSNFMFKVISDIMACMVKYNSYL